MIRALAIAFSEELHSRLDYAAMLGVCILNRQLEGTGFCASHEYCDAEAAMEAAFCRVFCRLADRDNLADVAVWAAAWNLARAEGFACRAIAAAPFVAVDPETPWQVTVLGFNGGRRPHRMMMPL